MPATRADRTRWQQRALREMTTIINKGAKAGLEPLMWQLGASGSAGQVSTLGLDLDEQQTILRDWAALLGWPVTEHRRNGTGELLRLTAAEPTAESWMLPGIALKVELSNWGADQRASEEGGVSPTR